MNTSNARKIDKKGITQMPLVSIIIVNWNGRKLLEECLASVFAQKTAVTYECIVVDNGSTDRSVLSISRKYPRVRIIKNDKNVGFAEGNNIGCTQARGTYILFLNNDAIVTKGFLSPLVSILKKNPHIGAVQPKIVQYPDTTLIDSVGSYFLPTGFLYHFGHNKKNNPKYEIASDIFSMKGACMLIRHDVLDRVGIFGNEYFAYFEETDLCHRIWLAGYRIQYVPDSVIYHIGGKTSLTLPSEYIQYHSYKNRIYTYLGNFEIMSLVRILPLHIALCLVISCLYVVTGKFRLGIAIINAILWNLIHISAIFNKRKIMKNIRVKKDSEYLPHITRTVRPSYYAHLFLTSLKGYED